MNTPINAFDSIPVNASQAGHFRYKALLLASVYSHLAAFHIPHIKLLQAMGCEVHAGASSSQGRREKVEETGAVCWEIPFERSPYSFATISSYRRLKDLFLNQSFDLIHVHTPVAAFLGRYLAKATKQGSVLYTAHGFHFYKGAPLQNWLVYYNAERLAARWTDALIVMNSEDFTNAKRLGFRPGQNLFLVRGVGVDLEKYTTLKTNNAIRGRLGIPGTDVVVTIVAEMNKNKNHEFILDAWKLVARRQGRCHLLLVGDGKLETPLRRKVKDKGIPRVRFMGYREDVPQILAETDIAALVSKREGLPRFLIEAMASGKPIVATDIRGNRDLVKDGYNGILVKLGDSRALALALQKLIENPDLRVAMGQNGRMKVQKYSQQEVLLDMANIYARLLNSVPG